MVVHWHCVNDYIGRSLKIMKEEPKARVFMPDLLLYELKENIWFGNDQYIERHLANGQFSITNPAANPLVNADVQFALHSYFVRKNQLDKAENAISAGLASLLLFDPKKNIYGYSKSLISLLSALSSAQDIYRAFGVMGLSANFIDRNLRHDSFMYAQYLSVVGNLLSATNNYVLIISTLKEASARISALEIDQELKDFELAGTNSLLSAAMLLNNDVNEAKEMHRQHPMWQYKNKIIGNKKFSNLAEYYFAISDTFILAASGEKADERWKALFENKTDWGLGEIQDSLLDSYRTFSLGLIAATHGDRIAGNQLLMKAANQRINGFEEILKKSFEAFPLASMVDRIVITFGIQAAAHVADAASADLMLRGSEILNRNLRDNLVDTGVIVDSQNNQSDKQDAQAFSLLIRQKSDWEISKLKKILDVGIEQQSIGRTVNSYSEVVSKLALLKSRLSANPNFNDTRGFPTVATLRAVLAKQEVFVTYVPVATGMLKLCISAEGFDSRIDQVDERKLTQSVKLLQFALSANHAADDKLDSQFPISAARFIYITLFDGLEKCMVRGSSVVAALPKALSGIPLSALLKENPPQADDGFDLRHAEWLIKEHSFSIVISPRQFVAAARASQRSVASRSYLGVGNPSVGNGARLLESVGNSALHGPAPVELPPLPETRIELLKAARLLNAPAGDILLGSAATEENFRAKPLSDYDVIHFATHNLTSEQNSGLTRTGLVFSGGEPSDSFDNGFLDASEISHLSLNARLVILSACNTAKYNLAQATFAAQDLQAAFTVAGAPTILASLWPVDSESSQKLIVGFLQAWRSSSNNASASLSISVRKFLDKSDRAHQHPRFWAPFVILGNGNIKKNAQHGKKEYSDLFRIRSTGGEIIQLLQDGGRVFLSMMADWDGKTMMNIISSFDSQGRQDWRLTSRNIGAGTFVVIPSTLISVGYKVSSDSYPIVRGIDAKGVVKWTNEFDDLKGYVLADGLNFKNSWLSIASPRSFGSRKNEPAFLIQIDTEGNSTKYPISDLAASNINGGPDVILARLGDRVFAAVNTGGAGNIDPKRINEIGFPRFCFLNRLMKIFELDLKAHSQRVAGTIPEFVANTIAVTDNNIYVGGQEVDGCSQFGNASIFRLDQSLKIDRFWKSANVFPTSIKGMTISPNVFEVAVAKERFMAIRDDEINVTGEYRKRWGENEKSVAEASIVKLSASGKLLSEKNFASGLGVWVHGIAKINGKSLLYGSLGGDPAMSEKFGIVPPH